MQLNDWMKQQGIGYQEFSELLGTSVATLNRIRSGEISNTVHVVRQIEKYTLGKVMLKDICEGSQQAKNGGKYYERKYEDD